MTDRRLDHIEARVRKSWTEDAGSLSRLASHLFGAATDLRNLLYDSGLAAPRVAPIPVVSVGGLTAGGSGKTPIAADLARRLTAAGVRTAIVTHGYPDELGIHANLCPGALRYGGRDREGLSVQAARDGAEIVVLDSGFQHRRLRKDLDIVAVDDVSLELPQRRLPAGPFREPFAALSRADLVVVLHRYSSIADGPDSPADPDTVAISRLVRHVSPLPPLAHARIVPVGLRPVTGAARARPARPRVVVAGIMWPRRFFAQLRELPEGTAIETEIPLADHAQITGELAARLIELGTDGGIACTLKDASKLACRLGDDVPLWYMAEEVVWQGTGASPAPLRAALALLPRRRVTRAMEPGR